MKIKKLFHSKSKYLTAKVAYLLILGDECKRIFLKSH